MFYAKSNLFCCGYGFYAAFNARLQEINPNKVLDKVVLSLLWLNLALVSQKLFLNMRVTDMPVNIPETFY